MTLQEALEGGYQDHAIRAEIEQWARDYDWSATPTPIDPEFAADAILADLRSVGAADWAPEWEEVLRDELADSAQREAERRA